MEAVARTKVLKHFENYLEYGYYPYYKEAGKDYLMRLDEVAQLVTDSDIQTAEENITYATRQKDKETADGSGRERSPGTEHQQAGRKSGILPRSNAENVILAGPGRPVALAD